MSTTNRPWALECKGNKTTGLFLPPPSFHSSIRARWRDEGPDGGTSRKELYISECSPCLTSTRSALGLRPLSCCPLLVLSPFYIVLVKHCRPCLAHGKYPVNTHLLIRTALSLEDKMDFNSQRAGGRAFQTKGTAWAKSWRHKRPASSWKWREFKQIKKLEPRSYL